MPTVLAVGTGPHNSGSMEERSACDRMLASSPGLSQQMQWMLPPTPCTPTSHEQPWVSPVLVFWPREEASPSSAWKSLVWADSHWLSDTCIRRAQTSNQKKEFWEKGRGWGSLKEKQLFSKKWEAIMSPRIRSNFWELKNTEVLFFYCY